MTRLLAFLTICAALHCVSPSWAQEPGLTTDEAIRSMYDDPAACLAEQGHSTTHDVADCLTDPDLAICLLRIEARRLSFRFRPEFAHAPAIVELIEEAHNSKPENDDPLSRAYHDAETRPFNEIQSLIAAALEADRQGATPETALRPIMDFGRDLRPQSFVAGQIVTASGAELRLMAYDSIWDICAHGRNGVRSSLIAPPSLALAHATLALWERELKASRDGASWREIGRLAGAYATLGDVAGLDRMARLHPGMVAIIRLASLLKDGRLEEASRLARRGEAMPDLRLRWRTILASLAAGRADLAMPIAQDLLRNDATSESEAPAAMAVIAAHDPARSVDALIETYDSRARRAPDIGSVTDNSRPRDTRSAHAAVVAVAGWLARGRHDRAQALLRIWRPIGEAWPENHGCAPDLWFACYNQTVDRMEGWFRRFDERIGRLGPSAQEAVAFDLVDGRRLNRLQQFLAHESDMYEIDNALDECVTTAVESGALDYAAECARLRKGSPYRAADRSLNLAAIAAESGDATLMREMLRAALELWRSARPAGWDWMGESARSLTRVGAALLRADGRL